MRSQADIGELVAKIFDRLPEEFPGCTVEDAMILVELSDPEEGEVHTEVGDRPATLLVLEATSDRVTIQVGILEFARRLMFSDRGEDDPEE